MRKINKDHIMITLKEKKENIEYIYHISDIHIHNNGLRNNEYEEVFDELFKSLNKNNSIVVLTGDIIHNKGLITAESVHLLKKFMEGILNKMDVIIIYGNHDININKKENKNVIDEVMKNINTKYKLYILKESGLYEYENIIFGLTAMDSNSVTECKINSNKIKVGLYHGTLNGSKTENITLGGTFGIKDFSDYDIVMLGDIHKHQYLNKKRTIAYSGSLIQQNVGENLKNHGYIRWNMTNMKSIFVEVLNRYGFLKLELNEKGIMSELWEGIKNMDEILDILINYNRKLKITINYRNITNEILKKIEDRLISIYGKHNIVTYSQDNKIDIEYSIENERIQDATDIFSAIKIIHDYINKDSNYDFCEDKFKEIAKEVGLKKTKKETKIIKLKSLKFDNLLTYGENNNIDFTKWNGIMGLISKNGWGKSSLIDIILYSIFDKMSRGNKGMMIHKNVVEKTNKKNSTFTDIILEVNNVEHRIKRKMMYFRKLQENKKNYIRTTQEVKYFINNIDVTETNGIKDTNKEIINNICGYNDLVDEMIMLQKGEKFLDMDNNEKCKYIMKILGFDIYDDIKNKTKEKISQQKTLIRSIEKELNKYNKNELLNNYNNISQILIIKNKEINDIKILLEDITKKKQRCEIFLENNHCECENIDIFYKKLKNKKKELENIHMEDINELEKYIFDNKSVIDTQKLNLNNEIKNLIKKKENLCRQIHSFDDSINYEIEINSMDNNLVKINEFIKNSNEILDKYNTNDIIDKCKLYDEYEIKKIEILSIINNLHENKIILENEQKIMNNYNYNEKCETCMANKKNMYLKFSDNENKIKEYSIKLTECNIILDNNKIYKKYKKENDEINNNLKLKKKERELIEFKLSNLKIEMEKKNRNKILENEIQEIEFQIIEKTNKLNKKSIEFDEKNKKLNDIKFGNNEKKIKIITLENEIMNINDRITKIINTNNDIEQYKQMGIEYDDYNKLWNEYTTKINELYYDKKNLEKKEIEMKFQLDDIKMLESKLELANIEENKYTKLFNLLESGGILENIMNNHVCKKIENGVNEIIKNVSGYIIKMKYEEKNIIINIINQHGCEIDSEMAGGFEAFLIQVAFRIVFHQYNNIIKTNFMILDEGFSTADSTNILNINELFVYLKKKFDWCLVISHQQGIQNYMDTIIEIYRKNETSKINL